MTFLTSHCLFLDNATINCYVSRVKRYNWHDKMFEVKFVLEKTTDWNES
jgi:hypothetical protein